MRLTDVTIRNMKPADKQVIYYDDQLANFGVRVGKKAKTFIVKLGERRTIKSIGRYPAITLSEARQEAKALMVQGDVPISKLRFKDGVQLFLKEAQSHNRPSTVRGYQHYLSAYDRNKKVAEITRTDIQDHLARYSDKPSGYSHALAVFKIFFNWCLRKDYIDRTPIQGERAIRQPSRERVLSPDEIRSLWEYEYPPFSDIVKLCLLTGQRRSEIAALVPEWIGEDTITFPKLITKNKRPHTIPASDWVLSYLNDLPFGRNGAYNGWSNGKRRIDRYVEIEHWTLHDLRRTFATIHAEIGTPIHITERLINHASGSLAGVVGIYNKYSYLDEMRAAQQQYEACLANIVQH